MNLFSFAVNPSAKLGTPDTAIQPRSVTRPLSAAGANAVAGANTAAALRHVAKKLPRASWWLPLLACSAASQAATMVATMVATMAEKQAVEQAAPLERIEVRLHQSYRGQLPPEQLPQAVTVIGSEQFSDWSLSRFQDVLDLSAGIARQNNGGGLWDSFSLRGFPGNENMPSGYLINGFNGGRGFSGHRDSSGIELVEILKGPGSALYGRSEPGGTINIVTRKPHSDHGGYLKASAGSYAQYRLEGDYNYAYSNSLMLRVNGAVQDYQSFRDEVTSEKQVLTPSVLWQIDGQSSLLYELEVLSQQQLFDRGIVVLNGDFQTVPHSRYLGEPADQPTEIDATGHQLTYQRALQQGWQLNLGAGYRDSSLQGFSSDAELARARQSLFDDGKTLTRQRRYRDYDSQDLTLRAELSGSVNWLGLSHALLAGVDGYDYQLYTLLGRYRGPKGSYALDILRPQYGNTSAGNVATLYENVETQQAYGVYLQDVITLASNWQLLLGMRLDDYRQSISERVKNTVARTDDQQISPRAGLTYQLSDAVLLYSNYAEGFLPLSGTDYAGKAFEPERSESVELGAKGQWHDWRWRAAWFAAEKSNILVSDPLNVGFSATLGAAQSRGLELELTGALGHSTSLNLAYSYLDSETLTDAVNIDWGVLVPKGSALVNIPRHTLSAQLQQQFSLAGRDSATGLRLRYQSQRLGDAVVPDFQLPSHTLWHWFVTHRLTTAWQAELVIENLFDKSWIQSSYSALWTYPGEPRISRLSLRYDF